MESRRTRLATALVCGVVMGLSAGCEEDDTPRSFLPPLQPDAGNGDGDGDGNADAGADSMEGGSFEASWCEPSYAVFYHPDNDPAAGTFTVKGTLKRSANPKPTSGQVSIAVLQENPVTRFIGQQEPELPVAQLLVRDCDWSEASDTLEFTLENIPKKDGENYYFATFFDTDKQARPLSVRSGNLTAAVSLTEVPRLPASPSGDTVEQDLDMNTVVP